MFKEKANIDDEGVQNLFHASKEDIINTFESVDGGDKQDVGIPQLDKERAPYQEFPRNEEDYEKFVDVENNPDAFPSFSKEERKLLQHQISRNKINTTPVEDIDPHDIDDTAEDFVLPPEFANYSLPARSSEEYPEPLLEKFIPDTAREKYRFDSQGLRACPGKRQRKGKDGKLYCHRIDLSTLHYLDTVNLARFIAADSSIMGRKATGLCSKCQRKVAKTIKRARNFGILPRIGEYVLQDSAPRRKTSYHVVSVDEKEGLNIRSNSKDHTLSKSVVY